MKHSKHFLKAFFFKKKRFLPYLVTINLQIKYLILWQIVYSILCKVLPVYQHCGQPMLRICIPFLGKKQEMVFALQSTHYCVFLPELSRNRHDICRHFLGSGDLQGSLEQCCGASHEIPTGGRHTWPPNLSFHAPREPAVHGSQYLDSWPQDGKQVLKTAPDQVLCSRYILEEIRIGSWNFIHFINKFKIKQFIFFILWGNPEFIFKRLVQWSPKIFLNIKTKILVYFYVDTEFLVA